MHNCLCNVFARMYTHWTENNQWINYIYIFKVQQNVWIKPKIHSGSTSHDGKSFLIANIVPISSHTLLTSIHYSKRQMQFGQNKISHLMVHFAAMHLFFSWVWNAFILAPSWMPVKFFSFFFSFRLFFLWVFFLWVKSDICLLWICKQWQDVTVLMALSFHNNIIWYPNAPP